MEEKEHKPEQVPAVLVGYIWKFSALFYLVFTLGKWWKGFVEFESAMILLCCGVFVTFLIYRYGNPLANQYFASNVKHIESTLSQLGSNIQRRTLGENETLPSAGGLLNVSALHGGSFDKDSYTDRFLLIYYIESRKAGFRAYLIRSTALFLFILTIAVFFLLVAILLFASNTDLFSLFAPDDYGTPWGLTLSNIQVLSIISCLLLYAVKDLNLHSALHVIYQLEE